MISGMGQEIRHAARRLRRSPAFTVASTLTLALAIGATASIFAVVQRVVVNPLPYPESDQLIELDHGSVSLNVPSGFGTTLGLHYLYSDRSRTLESLAVYAVEDATLTGGGEPLRIRVARASASLGRVLRVPPALGRWFTDAEGAPGGAPVAVLSHGHWMRRYGGDASILGRAVILDGAARAVVGVMPASFAFPSRQIDLWTPEPIARSAGFGLWSYSAVARLRGDATVEQARTELTGLIADLPRAYPNDPGALANAETRLVVNVATLKDATVGKIARALWILLASVGLVLLAACANVANLFLVRADARQREVAVRRALGAGRRGLAAFFFTESLLLSIAGSAAGLALASWAVSLLVTFGPPTLPRLHEIRLDAFSILFTLALGLLAGLAFGAIPLLRGGQLAGLLQEGGRGQTTGRARHRARHVLTGAQIALAVVLLVASGLMVRSFQKLRAVDPGFDASSALTFSVGLPDRDYTTREAAVNAHHAILDRLTVQPGVTAVSASTCLPLSGGCSGNTLRVHGRVYPRGTIPPLALFRAVAGGYFETMGMQVIRGRGLDRGDVERREPVAVVDEALVRTFFPDEDPIGQRVASNRRGDLLWFTIVGVVSNTPIFALAEARPMPQIYVPMSMAGGPGIPRAALAGPDISAMNYVVRSATPSGQLTAPARRAIDAVDPALAIANVRSLEEIVDRASAQLAFTMVLLAIAAGAALVLGAIGIYGVMSYVVSQRTGEIGVRVALGAEPGSVAAMIVRQGGMVALAGVVAGLAAAMAGSRLIASLLYGVSPRDPAVYATTAVILLTVALAACWLPARRAARLNPIDALKAN